MPITMSKVSDIIVVVSIYHVTDVIALHVCVHSLCSLLNYGVTVEVMLLQLC